MNKKETNIEKSELEVEKPLVKIKMNKKETNIEKSELEVEKPLVKIKAPYKGSHLIGGFGYVFEKGEEFEVSSEHYPSIKKIFGIK